MTVKAALIGLGNIAWKYDIGNNLKDSFARSQAGAFLRHSGLRLVGGFSPAQKDREEFQKWSGCPAFSCLDSMLDQTRPELVGICSPAQNHFDNFMTALSADARIIWLEKPPATNTEELRTMMAVAKKHGATVGVNYFRRTLPVYQELKHLLQEERLGKCQLIHILYSPGLARNGCHLLDQLFFLTGANDYELLWLEQADDRENPCFGLRLSTGHRVSVCGRNVRYHTNNITLVFDRGIVSVCGGGQKIHIQQCVTNPIAPGFYTLEDAKEHLGVEGINGHMDYALADLLRAYHTGKQPLSNLDTALVTQRLLEETLKAATP